MFWENLPALGNDFESASANQRSMRNTSATADESITAHDILAPRPAENTLESILRKAERLIDRYDMRAAMDQIFKMIDKYDLDEDMLGYVETLADRALSNLAQAGYHAEARQMAYRIFKPEIPDDEFSLSLAV